MKKTLSVILAVLIAMSLTVPVLAASAGLSADRLSLKKGETVSVTLSLSEAMEDITNFEYSIYFDPDSFELKTSEKGSACDKTMLSALKKDAKGSFYSVSFVDTTSEGVTINAGSIYTLSFEAVKTVNAATDSVFELKQVSVMDTSWQQVSSAVTGQASITVKILPEEGSAEDPGEEPSEPEEPGETASSDITLTVSAPASVERQAGTAFNAVIHTTAWDAGEYKLLDCVVNIPSGLEVTSVTADARLTGGSVNWHLDDDGTLRIVYNDATNLTTLAVTGSEYPASILKIGMMTTKNLTADRATISVGGASLKRNSDSEADDSMVVLKIGSTPDAQGNTGSAEITFAGKSTITVTAAELFVGDGIDLVPADVKGIVVSVTGLGRENVKLTYKNGETAVEMLYSSEISAVTGTLCYVAIVGKDEAIADCAKPANYQAESGKKADTVLFGDTNGDGLVNAQDALNAINAWTRSAAVTVPVDYLIYNVNSDSRINTFDALGIEEAFVSGAAFKIVTRAAALVSGK